MELPMIYYGEDEAYHFNENSWESIEGENVEQVESHFDYFTIYEHQKDQIDFQTNFYYTGWYVDGGRVTEKPEEIEVYTTWENHIIEMVEQTYLEEGLELLEVNRLYIGFAFDHETSLMNEVSVRFTGEFDDDGETVDRTIFYMAEFSKYNDVDEREIP